MGEWSLRAGAGVMVADRVLLGDRVSPNVYDTRASTRRAEVEVGWRPIEPWSLELWVPYLHKVLVNGDPPPKALHGDVPRKSLRGFGDVEARARWHASPALAIAGGAALPTGQTVDNPFAGAPDGATVLQLGNGTVDPLLGASYAGRLGDWRTVGAVRARLVLYQNARGFRAGSHALATAGASRPLWDGRVQPGLAAELFVSGSDRSSAASFVPGTETGPDQDEREALDTGMIAVLAAPGVSLRLHERAHLDLGARVPVFQRVRSQQVVQTWEVSASLRARLPSP